MTDVQRLLQHADPLAAEAPREAIEMHRMRQVVLATAAAQGGRSLRSIAIWGSAGVAVALIAVTVWLHDAARKGSPSRSFPAAAARDGGDTPALRQVHFSTAGGTRVVWVFNPDFDE